ncbi:MAG: hypothetical protein LBC18_14865 [Opitutaceae bacterium]|jgi:hypothetical protein|nr:hypothetical protein [Opitutaceae bacterium]
MKTTSEKTPLMTAPHEDDFGFFGTIKINENLTAAEAQAAWECAMETMTALTGGNATQARNFLRSRGGRHFADDTSFYRGSLAERIRQAAVGNYMPLALARVPADKLYERDPASDS